MARARFIKPEFFKHGELFDAELASGLPLRIAFAGIWTQADRSGRFVWKPRELKLDVLPYDDVDFGDVLDALERFGFVRSYVVEGKRYGVIPSFADHQPFHKNEPQSKLPSPPDIVPPPPSNGVVEPANDRRQPSKGRTKPALGRPNRSTTVTVTTTDTTAVTNTEKDIRPAGAGSAFPVDLCNRLHSAWLSHVGATGYPRFRKALLPLFPRGSPPLHTESEMAAAIEAFGQVREAQHVDRQSWWHVEKFAAEIHNWCRLGEQPVQNEEDGTFTERGRLAMGAVA